MSNLRARVAPVVAVGAVVATSVVPALPQDLPHEAWERQVGATPRDPTLQNKGVARLERFGDRGVLTILCGAAHSIYLDAPLSSVAEEIGRYLRVSYHYVERQANDPRCVQPPCDAPIERRVVIDRIERLSLDDEQASAMSRECATETGAPRQ